MNPSRRRSRVALATPVLLTVLALAPLSASLLPTTAVAADTAPLPIQISVSTLRPIAPQPGDTLVLTGTLHNASEVPVSNLDYELKLGGAIGSRGAFQEYAADPSGTLEFLTPASAITAGSPSTLAPEESEPFRLTLPLDATTLATFALPAAAWQVRELGISVTGITGTSVVPAVVGALRTFLPWAPRNVGGVGFPTRVAWIWPLDDRPHRGANSAWFDDGLARELSPNGRLAGLLNAGTAAEGQRPLGHHPRIRNVPVTWAIDPMLVSDVQAMAAGYRVTSPTGTATGTGTPQAKAWLGELRGAATHTDASVIPLPYADPDLVPAVRAGFATVIGLAATSGRTLLQQALGTAVNLLRYGWPPGGLADQRAIDLLAATGDVSVVLSDTVVPVIGGPPAVTPSAHTVTTTGDGPVDTLLTDSGLTADVNGGLNNPNGSRVSLQHFLAETLMIQAELPTSQRNLVVAPSRRWDPTPSYAAALLADTGKVPWIQPISLEKVDQSALYEGVQREPVSYPASARRNELSKSYLTRVAATRNQIGTFSSILLSGNAQITGYTTAEQEALSCGWRLFPKLAGDQLSALSANVAAQMSQVRITSHSNSYITLTSHGGKVPVTISNNLATPVRVTVKLEANQRLALSRHGLVNDVAIPAHQQTVVNVHAAAKTSGVFPVKVQLLTPQGKRYGRFVPLFVRSTAYGTITLIITGAATAALMVAVAIRLTRRAMAARRGAAGAST